MIYTDEKYMKEALKEAKKAFNKGEIPIGCVLVDEEGKIIARGRNKKEENEDVCSHAELNAIRVAGKKRNNWRLNGCKIYVTVEPCLMCASAIFQSRITAVIYGIHEPETGGFGGHFDIRDIENAKIEVKGGVLEDEAKDLMKTFFEEKRKLKK